jgi:MFS superfamily sulfate permease-like transporter
MNTNIPYLKNDLSAGFCVALVALPLSIGIALASGAPASAGLIAAIVGGLIGSWLGGGNVNVNGPAAGLIVIVLDAAMELGHGDAAAGLRGTLGACVVAGAFQVIFGLLKLGRKGLAFPASVIHGMMAAIGLIIIAKQTHLLMGHVPVAKNPLMLYAEIPAAFTDFDTDIFIIGGVSLIFLFTWNQLPWSWAKRIPGPLLTVLLGAILVQLFPVAPKSLLNVSTEISSWILFPDFSLIGKFVFWKATIAICLVASLESVLSAAAVDKLDPMKRKSDLDKDLISKGICNMVSAGIGGLPMIAEIVRSSANVSFGAKTWRANFFHGLILAILVGALPVVLNRIPIASLAAILIVIGARLGNPMHLLHAKKVGLDNLMGFAVTLTVTLAFDLLLGIFLGAFAQFLIEIYMGLDLKHAFKAVFNKDLINEKVNYKFQSSVTFSNFLMVTEDVINCLAQKKHVTLDFTDSVYIDHSVIDQIADLKRSFDAQGLQLVVLFAQDHLPVGEHELSAKQKKVGGQT